MRTDVRRSNVLLSFALAACATTGPGAGPNVIAVDATSQGQPLAAANCVASTNAGAWNVTTPGTVPVGNANGDLHILCNKPGYRSSEVVYQPSYGPSNSTVGIGLGGGGRHVGAGMGIGIPVNFGGGVGSYPPRIVVEMSPQ